MQSYRKNYDKIEFYFKILIINYEVKVMPVIEVKMWEGRTKEAKEKIIKGITAVFEELNVPPEAVTVIIFDVPKHNWGSEGKPCA